jgi:hypothetical protein
MVDKIITLLFEILTMFLNLRSALPLPLGIAEKSNKASAKEAMI